MTTDTILADPMQMVLEAIRAFPVEKEAHHCGESFVVSPFAIYSMCPACNKRIKVRSFSAATEIEDVFDAVFEWMNQAGAARFAEDRMRDIASDED